MASPYSSERGRRPWVLYIAVAFSVLATAACVTVRPEDKEFLSEPGMTFGSEGERGAHEEHVLSNREGSYGGTTATGGGCGCN